MLTLHYTGPKPRISHQGITFHKGKEDKYLYLHSAIKILQAIDKDYSKQVRHETHFDKKENHSDYEILELLQHYEPAFQTHIEHEMSAYKDHINEMIEEVNRHPLSEIEKKTWINNITLMKRYLLQRATNKLVYIHTIKIIKKLIRKYKIKEININFTLRNWHILTSIAGNLAYGIKRSTPTKISIETNMEGGFTTSLRIP